MPRTGATIILFYQFLTHAIVGNGTQLAYTVTTYLFFSPTDAIIEL